MRITIKQSGGYAGVATQLASVDTGRLQPASAQQVEQQVHRSGFFDLPADATPGLVGADLLRYEITVREGEREHRVTFADNGGPETASLRQLVQTVTGTA